MILLWYNCKISTWVSKKMIKQVEISSFRMGEPSSPSHHLTILLRLMACCCHLTNVRRGIVSPLYICFPLEWGKYCWQGTQVEQPFDLQNLELSQAVQIPPLRGVCGETDGPKNGKGWNERVTNTFFVWMRHVDPGKPLIFQLCGSPDFRIYLRLTHSQLVGCCMRYICTYMYIYIYIYMHQALPPPSPPWDGSHILPPYEIFPLAPVVWWGCGMVCWVWWCVWSVWYGMFGKYGMYGRYAMYGMNGWYCTDGRYGMQVCWVCYVWYDSMYGLYGAYGYYVK